MRRLNRIRLNCCISLLLYYVTTCMGADITGKAYHEYTEQGEPGVEIRLRDNQNSVVAQALTASDGTFRLENIEPSDDYAVTYRKVAHNIYMPREALAVGQESVQVQPVHVYSKSKHPDAKTLTQIIKSRAERASTKKEQIEQDLKTLEEFKVDAEKITHVKENLKKDRLMEIFMKQL